MEGGTVCRFKGGGGLGKKEGVLIPQCTICLGCILDETMSGESMVLKLIK